jgi:hypothetical protein
MRIRDYVIWGVLGAILMLGAIAFIAAITQPNL